MKTILRSTLGTVACMALLMTPAIASNQKSAAETHKITANKATPSAWPPESLTGTIVSVDPNKQIVVVKHAGGVPFDMILNRSTRIKAGQRELKPGDLRSEVNKNDGQQYGAAGIAEQRDGRQ